MALLTNTLEGASASGQTLNAANSGGGSGDAFAVVSAGASATLTYDTSSAFHGTYGVLVNRAPTASAASLMELRGGSGDTALAGAVYLKMTTLPVNDGNILGMQIRSTTDSQVGKLIVSSSGVLKIQNSTTTQATGSYTLSGGTWYRLEFQVSGINSTGPWSAQVYAGDSTTPLDSITANVTQSASGGVDRMRFGNMGPGTQSSYALDDPRFNYGSAVPLGPTTQPPYVGGDHLRYFKNYDYARLALEADQRGFIVGQSRIGVTKLRSTLGSWTSIKEGFTSITVNMACRIVDGAWLEPEVSSLVLVSRSASAFSSYDGTEIRLNYDGVTVFNGVVAESTLASEIGEDNTEEFTVTLVARGYESIRVGTPAVGTAVTLWGVAGGSTPVVQWVAGKVRRRAGDITGRPISAEDARADVQLEEPLAVENDVTGQQGELLADLAIRSGLLLDQSSGTGASFRSYQGVPLWALEDKHLVRGYEVAVDRETASALAVVRKEDETFVNPFRAGTGRAVTERTISLGFNDSFNAGVFAGYVPLQGDPKKYLVGATVPRHDDLPLTSRLPFQARFRHGGVTYRGAVIALQHTITKERWMIGLSCAPVHLVTRVSDLAPTPPAHLKAGVAGATVTLTWTGRDAGVVQSATSSSFSLLTADADNVDVLDEAQLYSSAGALKEDTIFRVTAKSLPSGGVVALSVTPAITAVSAAGDVLRFSDYGVNPDGGWTVWYQQGIAQDNRKIAPNVAGFVPSSTTVYTTSAVIPGLASGQTYRFTVYANSTTPNVRSAPSKYVEVVVP